MCPASKKKKFPDGVKELGKMQQALVGFCQAQERLERARKAVKDERSEARSAQQASREMLIESMQRAGVKAVRIPADGEGRARYARLVAAPAKYVPLESVDQILELLRGVGTLVSSLPEADIPDEVHRHFLERARAAENPAPRLRIVRTLPPAEEAASARCAGEPARLAQTFAAASDRTATLASGLRPLQATLRTAEAAARPHVERSAAPPRLVSSDADGGETVLRVQVRGAAPGRARALGVRKVGAMVRAAALVAALSRAPGADFETALRERLAPMLESVARQAAAPEQAPRAGRLQIVRERAPR
ncbi:MAG: hypothetical protein CL862_00440 [Cyanobium sp. NAT70]|nr:hypothetical protein [Cyanobium sp. NAT70]